MPIALPQAGRERSRALARADRALEARRDGAQRACAAAAGFGLVAPLDQGVNEAELDDGGGRQHERIESRRSYAGGDRADGEGGRQPRLDEAVEVAVVRVEVDLGGEVGALRQAR